MSPVKILLGRTWSDEKLVPHQTPGLSLPSWGVPKRPVLADVPVYRISWPAPLQKCCANFGGFRQGFSWMIFHGHFFSELRRKNPATKSARKSGVPKINIRENPFYQKPTLDFPPKTLSPQWQNKAMIFDIRDPTNGTRAHSSKPPFYKTALLFPLNLSSESPVSLPKISVADPDSNGKSTELEVGGG